MDDDKGGDRNEVEAGLEMPFTADEGGGASERLFKDGAHSSVLVLPVEKEKSAGYLISNSVRKSFL